MKIAIFSPTNTPITPTSIKDKPIGGADQALIKTIEALSIEGNEVHAFIPITYRVNYKIAETKTLIKNIFLYPFMDAITAKLEVDVLILYRKIWSLPQGIKAKRKIFYSQDTADTPCFVGLKKTAYKEVFNVFDDIIVLSKFHKENLKEAFQIPEEKFCIIGNGADPQEPIEKEDFTFIYASTPFRGLVVLARMWKHIKNRYPKSKLWVFSSLKIYNADILDTITFKSLYDKLKQMEGVEYFGSKPQSVVLNYMNRASFLLYPNTYPETYCNVINEARACRTPFITSDLGALKETGGNAGMYIKGNAYSDEYQKEFLEKLFGAIEYSALYKTMQEQSLGFRTWQNHKEDINRLINEEK